MSLRAAAAKPRRRIFWKIYLYSVLLLVITALGIGAIIYVIEKKPPRQGAPIRQAKLLASVLLPSLADEDQLQRDLNTYQSALEQHIAVYSENSSLLAAAGRNPPPPLELSEIASLPGHAYFHRGADLYVATLLNPESSDRTYLIMGELSPSGLTRVVGSLFVLFVFLVLASIPLSRAIASPLERLTICAGRLSEGDLTARTDVTSEDELGRLGTAMNAMASQLATKIRREKELLGNISHEIRTPLSRIKVALELCEGETSDADKMASRLQGITSDLGELDQMVEDILIATRLDLATELPTDAGIVLRKKTIKPDELIDETSRAFSDRHPDHSLQVKTSEAVPFEADPALLRRVLANILDNAARHTSPSQPIELNASFGAEHATFEIRDRGTGIDEEEITRIFDPFYRSQKNRAPSGSGVGLGLSLCKRIVEAHGGSIASSSHPDSGTLFSFTIPL